MPPELIPTYYFVLVVVEYQGRFILVQETRFENHWYLPAGRVEPREDLITAAKRETLEEAGIEVELMGVIRIEHTPGLKHTRLRVVFHAQPHRGAVSLKKIPDEETLGAKWFTPEEIEQMPLRGEEIKEYIRHVVEARPIASMEILGKELNLA